MKSFTSLLAVILAIGGFVTSTFSQEPANPATATKEAQDRLPADQPKAMPAVTASPAASSAGQPNEAEMMKQMTEMAKLNENHKLLADLDGTWNYTVKMWMSGDPSSKPQESKGHSR